MRRKRHAFGQAVYFFDGLFMTHATVLLEESVAALNVQPGSRIIDGTINGGGHSERILELMQGSGTLVGIDLDADALARAKERLRPGNATVHLLQGSYADMLELTHGLGYSVFDGVLLDLGLSSNQLEESGRGFSFRRNEPLLMNFQTQASAASFTARDIVNDWDEETIADVLYGYGEERFARKIAREIVATRGTTPIETTDQLVSIVLKSTPGWYHHGKTHPATKTFQALRIAVNDELEGLKRGITAALELLAPGGRLAIISFHSIEDRIVKQAYLTAQKQAATVITKKPIVPSREELASNPRARSAKLRILEKHSAAADTYN